MKRILTKVFTIRTLKHLHFDLLRAKTRIKNNKKNVQPAFSRLHIGCGKKKIQGWLNVDVDASDYDVDLASGKLPWIDHSFDFVASQHLIEHLELELELIPLLKELKRVTKPGGEIWLSCPDMEKVCRGYVEDKGKSLVADRKTRHPSWDLNGIPSQHIINYIFQQRGEHRNLFDFELLAWCLEKSGFIDTQRVEEKDFLNKFPEFPLRRDDLQSLYVKASA